MEYLEEVKNPGKDDGNCALCSTKGLTEENRCFGCGYLVCDLHPSHCCGQHLVVEHDDEEEEEEEE